MAGLSLINPKRALLVMDFQVDVLTKSMPEAEPAEAIARIPELLVVARSAGMMVIHVIVVFRPGHPEVSPFNTIFSWMKAHGLLLADSEGARIHPAAIARGDEPIVVKHRTSPFAETDLAMRLRANAVDTLVLAGVHTSGAVLSTVRQAADLDYRLVVARDCCADPDAKVHAMLLDRVIAKQATVASTAAIAALTISACRPPANGGPQLC